MGTYKIKSWFLFFFLLVVVFLVNVPIITMIANSLRSTSQILSTGFLQSTYSFDNYIYLHTSTRIWHFFKNSIIVAVTGTAASIIISAFAGFALSRFENMFTAAYSRLLLMLQMFPLILVLIPLFILFKKLGLSNTYTGVILIYTAIGLPFATWMYKGFFDAIPKELEEAAWMDGCSRIRSFFTVVLPLSGPGITAVSIYSFLLAWNEFMLANIFLKNNELMTIPVGIQMFVQQYQSDVGSLMASTTLAMVPAFIFFLFGQKYIVSGAVAGGVKG